MRRNASFLVTSMLVVSLAGGCSLFRKNKPVADAGFEPAATYVPPAAEPTERESLYRPATEPVQAERSYDTSASLAAASEPTPAPAPTPAPSAGPRYHTVVRHDTLYGLARRYYGDARRWRDIYEANRNVIRDPNQIRVGQRLLIP